VTEGLQTPGKAHGESLSMHIGGVCVKKIAFAVSTLSSCLVLSCSNVVFADTSQEDINLALNKPYTVSAPIPDPLLSADEQSWFPDTGGKLTDGKFLNPKLAPSTNDQGWVGFVDQDDRSIVIDLGQTDTVHALTADFLNDPGDYVHAPEKVIFSVSLDRIHWQSLQGVNSPITLADQSLRNVTFVKNGVNLQARYVRVQFPVDTYVLSDQIQVLGVRGIVAGAKVPRETPNQIQPSLGYAKVSQTGGANQILLCNMWLSEKYDQRIYPWDVTEQQWLPMITYMDGKGHIRDWMFKTVLAMPNVDQPSATQQDWTNWLDDIFHNGGSPSATTPTQLNALNQAVGHAKAALHDPNYQEKVIISIPYPDPSVTNWGSMSGRQLDFSHTVDRQKAVAWYLHQVEQLWNSAHYNNLKLVGFYWFNEGVDVHQPGEVQLLQHTSRLIHANHLRFYWIPYFEAPGYKIWRTLGFDVAIMQPNYAFYDAPVNRLTETAELAKHYQLGVEMEFPFQDFNPGATKGTNTYLQYQDAALAYHFNQNVPLAWYQNTQGVLTDYQQNRVLYDLIYEFLKGTYVPQKYVPSGNSYTLVPDDSPNLPPFTWPQIPAGLSCY
jgi:hypothetical protein